MYAAAAARPDGRGAARAKVIISSYELVGAQPQGRGPRTGSHCFARKCNAGKKCNARLHAAPDQDLPLDSVRLDLDIAALNIIRTA
jgi:hypothetical protein